MSKLVQISEIEPGMILKKPVKNSFGQILLCEDVTLTSKHILILKTWNISSVFIDSDEEEEQISDFSEEDFSLATAKLKERINWEPRNENEHDLLKLGIIDYLKSNKI